MAKKRFVIARFTTLRMKRIALVRGKFLNAYEMQMYEPLVHRYAMTAFSSLTPIHDSFSFPVVKLPSPMDLPEFPYKMPICNRVFVDAHYLFGLEKNLRGFDIVHTAETYYHYTQQALNAKKYGYAKKVIATVLENIPFNNEGIWGRAAFKKRARKELDHIIALSQGTKEALVREGADAKKISVVGFYIDTDKFSPGSRWLDTKKKEFTLLFVGRLEEYKGVFDALMAFKQLLLDNKLSSYTLRIQFVGNGSKKQELQKAIRVQGLESQSTIMSANYFDMPQVYQQADLCIAPSKTAMRRGRVSWKEQYGMMLLEAQSAGLPIVTTNSGAIAENIADAGILVSEGDVFSMTMALKQYILNANKRIHYAKAARKRAVTTHAITIGAKKLSEIYDKLME